MAIQSFTTEVVGTFVGDGVTTSLDVALSRNATVIDHIIVSGGSGFSVSSFSVKLNIVTVNFSTAPASGYANGFNLNISYYY